MQLKRTVREEWRAHVVETSRAQFIGQHWMIESDTCDAPSIKVVHTYKQARNELCCIVGEHCSLNSDQGLVLGRRFIFVFVTTAHYFEDLVDALRNLNASRPVASCPPPPLRRAAADPIKKSTCLSLSSLFDVF